MDVVDVVDVVAAVDAAGASAADAITTLSASARAAAAGLVKLLLLRPSIPHPKPRLAAENVLMREIVTLTRYSDTVLGLTECVQAVDGAKGLA